MRRLPIPRPLSLYFLHCIPDPHPHPLPIEIAQIEQFVSAHDGLDDSMLAVLVDQELGGAVDVEVGGHVRRLQRRWQPINPSWSFWPETWPTRAEA